MRSASFALLSRWNTAIPDVASGQSRRLCAVRARPRSAVRARTTRTVAPLQASRRGTRRPCSTSWSRRARGPREPCRRRTAACRRRGPPGRSRRGTRRRGRAAASVWIRSPLPCTCISGPCLCLEALDRDSRRRLRAARVLPFDAMSASATRRTSWPRSAAPLAGSSRACGQCGGEDLVRLAAEQQVERLAHELAHPARPSPRPSTGPTSRRARTRRRGSSSGPPGACMTPSSVTNVLTTSLRINSSLRRSLSRVGTRPRRANSSAATLA